MIDRRLFLAGATALAASPALPAGVRGGFPNPLVRQRADAQVFRHTDGAYYMTASVPEYDRVVLRRATSIAGLAAAPEKVLWRHLARGPMSGFIWAPELHLIDGAGSCISRQDPAAAARTCSASAPSRSCATGPIQ